MKFFHGSAEDAVNQILGGGLLVAPSGPGLSKNLVEDSWYGEALDAADIVLPDSGLMVLIWNWIARHGSPRITRVSGLEFLNRFLCDTSVKSKMKHSFWIMPSLEENLVNQEWLLQDLGVDVPEASTYVAPMYSSTGPVTDELLLENIRSRSPSIIFLNIGGGVQERSLAQLP